MSALLQVEDAIALLLQAVESPTASEIIPVTEAFGRVLAEPLEAIRTQPPFAASAMDGYAIKAEDAIPGNALMLVGESAAGKRYPATLQAGQAIRIFTGAPIPDGADSILIQENATLKTRDTITTVMASQAPKKGQYVRPLGGDFLTGQSYFAAGYRLQAKDMALAASLGMANALVRRRPRVGVLATGDELVNPGETPGEDQIVAANHLSVMALAKNAGADVRFLGIAPDTLAGLAEAIGEARAWPADILVTMGGASVGDHDLVQAALSAAGMKLAFWRIAMRPGKPLMSGSLGSTHVLSLPGNPASSIVCAHLFLRPLIAAYLGTSFPNPVQNGRLGRDLPANDLRQDYLRSTVVPDSLGVPVVTPHMVQDSSLSSVLALADGLLIRKPYASAAMAGEPCLFMRME